MSDMPFDSRIVNLALRCHSLLGPTFMINCQLFWLWIILSRNNDWSSFSPAEVQIIFLHKHWKSGYFFNIKVHLWPSSFLPRLTASVIFLNMILQSGGKYENLLYIFTPYQFYANQPPFQALVLCFERSKRKRAFPKALRLTQSGVRGLNLF